LKTVSILGATGSIGQNTIDLIKRRPDEFDVVAVTGGHNLEQLAASAVELGAQVAVTCFDEKFADLKELLSGTNVEVKAGEEAVVEAASMPVDWTMSAIVGAAGLRPGMASLSNGKTLALANKESLVSAGQVFMGHAKAAGATVLPVDSEHSAVFQALIGEEMAAVERVIITASGGAFRDWPIEKLKTATLAEASSHPNWDMGQRITIDSASMFNKAMELIETKEFFGVSSEQIETVIHPESLIHALVGFNDGALMAHVGPPDMRHAIGFALNWPDRIELPVERLNLTDIGQLTFRAPDDARYPALAIARDVMEIGGLAGAVFTAAKERALDAFIAGQIGFMDMAPVVSKTLDKMSAQGGLQNAKITLDSILDADKTARIYAGEFATN